MNLFHRMDVFYCHKSCKVILIMTLAFVAATMSAREKININLGWKHCFGELPGAEAVGYNDTKWTSVDIPHDA
ncbi:MAG: hypothetical protein PHU58_06010, partial [Prevotella sp.]|nr:hypothetical protein [Prevotella sp.]